MSSRAGNGNNARLDGKTLLGGQLGFSKSTYNPYLDAKSM